MKREFGMDKCLICLCSSVSVDCLWLWNSPLSYSLRNFDCWILASLAEALICCSLDSLSSAASSFVVAGLLSLLLTQSMTSTLKTCLSLFGSLRCPLSWFSALLIASPIFGASVLSFHVWFSVHSSRGSFIIESISELSTKHCTAYACTWVNVAQQG